MSEKTLGQICFDAFQPTDGDDAWKASRYYLLGSERQRWEQIAQAVVIETQRQHQLEMGYYPSMLEKSEEECCELGDALKRARELLSRAKPFCVGKEGDSRYCDDAHAIRKEIVEFLIKAPVV